MHYFENAINHELKINETFHQEYRKYFKYSKSISRDFCRLCDADLRSSFSEMSSLAGTSISISMNVP